MWTSSDLEWLKENYPGIKEKSDKKLEGSLSFRMLSLDNQFIVNPTLDQIQKTTASDYLYLCDTYRVRIEWENEESYYPISYEVGGKLEATAKRLNKRPIDMHQYSDSGALCLVAPMDLDSTFLKGFQLNIYVENFLIPYLFAQSYYAKKQVWLWGDLKHGVWGLLEWLGRKRSYTNSDVLLTYISLMRYTKEIELKKILGIRCRNHKPCPCGSGEKTQKCHPDIQPAISRLRSGINSGLMNFSRT